MTRVRPLAAAPAFTYDNDNRETAETWVVSGSTVNLLTFTYDGNGNTT